MFLTFSHHWLFELAPPSPISTSSHICQAEDLQPTPTGTLLEPKMRKKTPQVSLEMTFASFASFASSFAFWSSNLWNPLDSGSILFLLFFCFLRSNHLHLHRSHGSVPSHSESFRVRLTHEVNRKFSNLTDGTKFAQDLVTESQNSEVQTDICAKFTVHANLSAFYLIFGLDGAKILTGNWLDVTQIGGFLCGFSPSLGRLLEQ